MNNVQFLKQFLRYPTATCAIAESSRELADLITDSAELWQASVVVEFGSGTGVFTEKILEKISEDAKALALEVNPVFVEETKRRCPKALVCCDSAVNAAYHLKEAGVDECDRIICGLPWACFDQKLQDQLLDTIMDILKPGGKFLTFAYLHGLFLPSGKRFRRCLSSRFQRIVATHTIWKNLPPAFVYCAER
ncbi:methyltransferase domain-containing protein [Acidobacteria bacterium AH-259-D05]|nr:methyltransferase domain-containing protein [Acidobacteria bacterium AH-259-D05]